MGSTFFTFSQKCLIQKVGFLGGLRRPHSTNFFLDTKISISNSVFLENSFFDPSWRLKDMACSNLTFQELISHWSLSSHSNGLQYQIGLGLSFPKWYDTCIFVEKWPHNGQKPEE